jgi:hypothetical protein
MSPSNTWTIEYSHSEENFHVGKTAEMLRRNIHSVQSGRKMDFICVGIFPSKEQAIEAILEFRRNRIPGKTISLMF